VVAAVVLFVYKLVTVRRILADGCAGSAR